MFAAITQYKLKLSKNDGPPLTYGLPLLVAGTLSLGAGMFLCAFIVETSTEECVWIPQPAISPTAAAVIWLQQGGQTVGDQRFECFARRTTNNEIVTSEKRRLLDLLWSLLA